MGFPFLSPEKWPSIVALGTFIALAHGSLPVCPQFACRAGVTLALTHLLSLLRLLDDFTRPVAGPLAWWLLLLQGAEESFCSVQFHLQLCDLKKSAQTVADPFSGANTPGSMPNLPQGPAKSLSWVTRDRLYSPPP